MSYNCMIVDDEELARELIETYLDRLTDFELVASCENALEAREVLQHHTIDLIFLDIEMPILKGTDFLKNLAQQPKVIFTTAYRDYAIEGFELNAIDYLLKPIEFERFFKAIEKFTQSSRLSNGTEPSPKHHIFVQSHKKNIKIILEDICYVESLKDYIRIHFEQDKLMIKTGITAFAQQLDQRFIRVHRSFLVNKNKLTAFTRNHVEIKQQVIPIGEHYKKEVLEHLK